MIPPKYFVILEQAGWPLDGLGLKQIGLERQAALQAIKSLRNSDVGILGGDVYKVIAGEIESDFANWYCQKEDYENRQAFLEGSWTLAEKYIQNYNEPDNAITIYTLVLDDSNDG